MPTPPVDGYVLQTSGGAHMGGDLSAFSDVRRLITNAALTEGYLRLWPFLHKSPKNPFVSQLMPMVA